MSDQTIPKSVLTDNSPWEGDITLSVWQGFQSRQGVYGSKDSQNPSTGLVRITVDQEENQQIPSPEQVRAYHYLIDNQESIKEAILNALLLEYDNLKSIYDYEEDSEMMPNIQTATDFRNLIGLSSVHLSYVQKDGLAYVGYEFGCNWDDEHGLGVMTHGERVVEIGGADTSFLWWVADRDARGKNE